MCPHFTGWGLKILDLGNELFDRHVLACHKQSLDTHNASVLAGTKALPLSCPGVQTKQSLDVEGCSGHGRTNAVAGKTSGFFSSFFSVDAKVASGTCALCNEGITNLDVGGMIWSTVEQTGRFR